MKKTHPYLIIILLLLAAGIAFGRIAGNEFINFDDGRYIISNDYVQSGFQMANIKWAFTTAYLSYWHPLTWLSHMLDWSLFGADATGHHLVSLMLHTGAVIFLFVFLYKTTDRLWPAAFAAAFFALHPLRVESVAWAAERKDVLSMFFGMACLYAYAFYTEAPKLSRYMLCLFLYGAALMSKPMLVTLPLVLMLLDYWPLQRRQAAALGKRRKFHLIVEKIPFILLAVAVSIVTLLAKGKIGATSIGGTMFQDASTANAVVSYVAYLGKTLWPFNLAVFYPYHSSLSLWTIFASATLLVLMSVAALYHLKALPYLFVGWFWYLLTLIPVIGLVQSGAQSMADRYTYLPSVGLAVALAWGIDALAEKMTVFRKILFPAAMLILVVMTSLAWMQCGYWKNSLEIWNHAILATKENYLAFTNRGAVYGEIGLYEKAIADYDEAIRLKPDHGLAYNNRGGAYLSIGKVEQGCRDIHKACELGLCRSLEIVGDRGICR